MRSSAKQSRLTSTVLGYGLETLSKAALIDLVADLARRELGEDKSDWELASYIEKQHEPVARVRGSARPGSSPP
jgi:hypothetical protein